MLRESIPSDLTAAMKARDSVRVSTLRMLLAAMKNTQVERRHELSDEEVIEVAAKEAKRRREAIEAYTAANRQDLSDKESAELNVLEAYLPASLSENEIERLVDDAIAESGASEPQHMGAVMKVLMPKVKGRADGNLVSNLVKQKLSSR